MKKYEKDFIKEEMEKLIKDLDLIMMSGEKKVFRIGLEKIYLGGKLNVLKER